MAEDACPAQYMFSRSCAAGRRKGHVHDTGMAYILDQSGVAQSIRY